MRFKFILRIAALLAIPGIAVAQDKSAAGWQPMSYFNFQVPSTTDPLQTLVWPDVIREANAYVTTELKRPLGGRNALVTALASTYRDGNRTIIVSTALSRACDSGANDKGAEIEPSTCPLRIATIENGKVLGTPWPVDAVGAVVGGGKRTVAQLQQAAVLLGTSFAGFMREPEKGAADGAH